jgi:hypothetical protein
VKGALPGGTSPHIFRSERWAENHLRPPRLSHSRAARQVIQRVEALEAAGAVPDIVVVGAGYAGVELAASLTDRFGGAARVKIVAAGARRCWSRALHYSTAKHKCGVWRAMLTKCSVLVA